MDIKSEIEITEESRKHIPLQSEEKAAASLKETVEAAVKSGRYISVMTWIEESGALYRRSIHCQFPRELEAELVGLHEDELDEWLEHRHQQHEVKDEEEAKEDSENVK